MSRFTDCMLDTETLGTKPGCVIRSVAAVFFDPYTGEIGPEFYANITRESCEQVGLKVDQSTLDWWNRQPQAAKDALEGNKLSIRQAMSQLADFLTTHCRSNDLRMWAQGSAFDFPIVEAAASAVQVRMPYQYWNVMDTRTVYHIRDFNPTTLVRIGTYHNALEDCRHQVRCLVSALGGVVAKTEIDDLDALIG